MKRDFHIGPGAASLILIIVILAMSALSILSLTNARSDERLSVRSVKVVESEAALDAAAERTLAELDAMLVKARNEATNDEDYLQVVEKTLSNGKTISGDLISWVEEDDGRVLNCAVQVLPLSSENRLAWKEHRLSSEFAEIELEDTWN